MYMNDIKLFAKNEKELETRIQTVRIHSQDRGMEFGIEKCIKLGMKSGKRHITEGVERPNPSNNQNARRKYLGILEADTIKQVEMKEKIKNSISEESEN